LYVYLQKLIAHILVPEVEFSVSAELIEEQIVLLNSIIIFLSFYRNVLYFDLFCNMFSNLRMNHLHIFGEICERVFIIFYLTHLHDMKKVKVSL
jgi:hypothetical protein